MRIPIEMEVVVHTCAGKVSLNDLGDAVSIMLDDLENVFDSIQQIIATAQAELEKPAGERSQVCFDPAEWKPRFTFIADIPGSHYPDDESGEVIGSGRVRTGEPS